MKKVFYEKVGRNCVPVSEYNSDYLDSFSKGTHIVMSYPGGQSRRYNIDPAFAPMIAAGRFAEDAMSKAMVTASELKPQRQLLTPGQKKAWEKLAKELGDELATLQGASTHDIIDAGVKAMQTEATKLMKHESVKAAYEQFLLVAELTKEHNETQI